MAQLTTDDIRRLEEYYALMADPPSRRGRLRRALDPVGTAAVMRAVRDVIRLLGYRVVWVEAQQRYRLVVDGSDE